MNKIILFFLILNFGLFNPEAQAQESAQLWITRGFNQEILLNKEVLLENQSVMKILQRNAVVKTSFAGSFVTEINGIRAEDDKSWFYYVNGCLAQVGALAYLPKNQDRIWFDFHRWDNAVYISSVIGSYPEPFLNGCQESVFKTEIFSTEKLWTQSQRLLESLTEQGVDKIELKEYTPLNMFNANAVILIASWENLKNNPSIMDAAKNYQKSGFFIKFHDGKLGMLNILGQEVKSFDHAGAILALGSGFAGSPPLWVMTGTDNNEVEKILNLLINEPERIKFHSGIVLSEGEIYNVPIQE